MSKLNALLHNQTFWRIIWIYSLILYPYSFLTAIFTGQFPIIISETFTDYLYIVSAVFIAPFMSWGAYNQFRISRNAKKENK